MSGLNNYSSATTLNEATFAAKNRVGQIRPIDILSGNLRLQTNSAGHELAREVPLPQPETTIFCPNDAHCVDSLATDDRWNLPAEICRFDNLCVVDIATDSDADTDPDWLELILGSNPHDPFHRPLSITRHTTTTANPDQMDLFSLPIRRVFTPIPAPSKQPYRPRRMIPARMQRKFNFRANPPRQ